MNGADKKVGLRDQTVADWIQNYPIQAAKRAQLRKTSALKARLDTGATQTATPSMKKVLSKKMEELKKPVSFKFMDSERKIGFLEVKTTGSVVVATRTVTLHEQEPECECGAPEIEESPCACMLYVAEKAGMPTCGMVNYEDTVEFWKEQYEDLDPLKVPGNEAIIALPPDTLAILPPVAFPAKAGRQTKGRVKSAMKIARIRSKKMNAKNVAADEVATKDAV